MKTLKKKIAVYTLAIAVVVVFVGAMTVSALTPLGQNLPFTVDTSWWSNRTHDSKWELSEASQCVFSASAGASCDFEFKQWRDPFIGDKSLHVVYNTTGITSSPLTLAKDDYYARVKKSSAGTATGWVKLT
ncbi:MAG: hypothetical protein LBR85_09220 [Oscillospiraceae bacterium]|jgi:hypothetical protein|nr:hypothetical protein [Oscillospiraceae bacterium]